MKLEKSHQETKEVGGSIGPRKSGGGAFCCRWRCRMNPKFHTIWKFTESVCVRNNMIYHIC